MSNGLSYTTDQTKSYWVRFYQQKTLSWLRLVVLWKPSQTQIHLPSMYLYVFHNSLPRSLGFSLVLCNWWFLASYDSFEIFSLNPREQDIHCLEIRGDFFHLASVFLSTSFSLPTILFSILQQASFYLSLKRQSRCHRSSADIPDSSVFSPFEPPCFSRIKCLSPFQHLLICNCLSPPTHLEAPEGRIVSCSFRKVFPDQFLRLPWGFLNSSDPGSVIHLAISLYTCFSLCLSTLCPNA